MGMYIRIPIFCLVFFFNSDHLFAQQETYLTHSSFNPLMGNPGFAGRGGRYEISANHHRQWIRLMDYTGSYRTPDGLPPDARFPALVAPVTSVFSFSAPIARCISGEKTDLGGFAVTAVRDVIGYELNTHVKFAAAAAVKWNNVSELRLGLEMNYLTRQINAGMLRAIQMPDPMIPAGNQPGDSRWIPGAGIVFSNHGRHPFYTGLGITGLFRPEFRYTGITGAPVVIGWATHLQWMSGMEYSLPGNSAWQMLPVLVIRSANDGRGWVMPQMDLQCQFEYQKRFSAGTALRVQKNGMDAVSFLLGFHPGNFQGNANGRLRIGYAFDLTMQTLKQNSRNTHEIQINYTLERPCRFKSRIRHPRDLRFNRGELTKLPVEQKVYKLGDQ